MEDGVFPKHGGQAGVKEQGACYHLQFLNVRLS